MAQSSEDEGLFIQNVPIHGVSFLVPARIILPLFFEVSGAPLLAKVTGSRWWLAHALHCRAGGSPETPAYEYSWSHITNKKMKKLDLRSSIWRIHKVLSWICDKWEAIWSAINLAMFSRGERNKGKILCTRVIKKILKKSEAGTLFQQCLPRWK